MAGFQNQPWNQDAVDLWGSRILSWVNQFGERNVDSVAEWAIDRKEDLHDRQIDISIFRARLGLSLPQGDKDGPITMCLLCRNTGFYPIQANSFESRHEKCPHPHNKQQGGWRMERGITIPPGESLKSMRANYDEFREMFLKLQIKTKVGPK